MDASSSYHRIIALLSDFVNGFCARKSNSTENRMLWITFPLFSTRTFVFQHGLWNFSKIRQAIVDNFCPSLLILRDRRTLRRRLSGKFFVDNSRPKPPKCGNGDTNFDAVRQHKPFSVSRKAAIILRRRDPRRSRGPSAFRLPSP